MLKPFKILSSVIVSSVLNCALRLASEDELFKSFFYLVEFNEKLTNF
jgi:hypothetical protein